MKKLFLKILAILLAFSGFIGFSGLITAPAFAEDEPAPAKNICDYKTKKAAEKAGISGAVWEATGCSGNSDAVVTIVQTILNSIITVMGIVAVIFIVIGGVNYMTSQGDPGKLKKAKDTILYACIGLVVCALAFAIVNWTIGILNNADKSANQNQSEENNDTGLLLDTSLRA